MPLDRVREQSFDGFVHTQRDRGALCMFTDRQSRHHIRGSRTPNLPSVANAWNERGRTMRSPRSSSVDDFLVLCSAASLSTNEHQQRNDE